MQAADRSVERKVACCSVPQRDLFAHPVSHRQKKRSKDFFQSSAGTQSRFLPCSRSRTFLLKNAPKLHHLLSVRNTSGCRLHFYKWPSSVERLLVVGAQPARLIVYQRVLFAVHPRNLLDGGPQEIRRVDMRAHRHHTPYTAHTTAGTTAISSLIKSLR